MQEFDVARVRALYPALAGADGAPAPIFLDNPGGTQVPQPVVDAVTDCLIGANANLGGAFRSSRAATKLFDDAHVAMADFFNARSAREIVFGQNMTTLTMQMSRSLARTLQAGDEIVVTRMEHDANVAPWLLVARDLDLTVKFLPFDTETYEFDLSLLDGLLSERTKLVCVNHASNLTGTINDVKTVSEKAHSVGALVYVDSVQFAPHGAIDVQALDCDFLVCSPYKFFGPHLGVLWGREELLTELDPYKVRTASDALPHRFETGTLNHEGMAGAMAAVDYFAWIGRELGGPSYCDRHQAFSGRRQEIRAAMDCMFDYETPITRRLIEGLSALPGVKVHGITNPNAMARRVPTVSFTAEGHQPQAIASALGEREIYVWSGHNYALEPATQLGIAEEGVVRIGLVHYNTAEEVERTLEEIEAILG
ncbi:MAG: cysteine desulfurase-like protein [Pseudomonadota bacterium]